MRVLSTAIALAMLLSAGIAAADVAPPDLAGCQKKKVGDSCKTDAGKTGACVKDTCYKNDYSDGVPPKQKAYECIRCKVAADADKKTKKKTSEAPSMGRTVALAGGGLVALALGLLFVRRRNGQES